jgi:hypothetical protein
LNEVRVEDTVGAEQGNLLGHGLGDEQTVKRITVMEGQSRAVLFSAGGDWEASL